MSPPQCPVTSPPVGDAGGFGFRQLLWTASGVAVGASLLICGGERHMAVSVCTLASAGDAPPCAPSCSSREGPCGSSLPHEGLGEAEGPSGWFLARSPATYGARPPSLGSQSTDSCFRTCQLKTPTPPSVGFVAWLLPGGLGWCGLARPQPRCQPDCPARRPPSQPSRWPEGLS